MCGVDRVLVEPGDIVLFDSYLPHRSFTNASDTWRRSAYLTFNRAAEGDLHAAYYAKKREAFAQGTAGTISINKDFGGAIVQVFEACVIPHDIASDSRTWLAQDLRKICGGPA